jgi:D-alanine-D-alanine ligase
MRVTVLAGGPSNEREISLTSGRAVAAALKEAGHQVHLADAEPRDLSALGVPTDVIFPVLHGEWGESGELQEILETFDFPFVGSGSAASRLGMNKVETKRLWQLAGLPTPPFRLIDTPSVRQAPGPCVVKPVSGGSSIDCFLRKTAPEATADVSEPVSYLVAKYGHCMIEQYIDGWELTVGILFDKALPPIWIDPGEGQWFDYQQKYSPRGAAHRFDLPPVLDEHGVARLQQMCLEAHQIIGARDLSRVDVMIDRAGTPFLLEINTMPGFTGRSLLPDAARHAGMSFAELCDALVNRAARRQEAAAA